MRSNAVGGGGVLYFKLGVGRCSYDASTRSLYIERKGSELVWYGHVDPKAGSKTVPPR
jgi:hypothetical protein